MARIPPLSDLLSWVIQNHVQNPQSINISVDPATGLGRLVVDFELPPGQEAILVDTGSTAPSADDSSTRNPSDGSLEEEEETRPTSTVIVQQQPQLVAASESSTTSMMEQLPPEVMTHLLSFSPIRDRGRVALCNNLLDNRIYKDCPELWETIDLSELHYPYRRLTDNMLSSFLKRVNAKQVTKSLDIRRCDQVSGRGLFPLFQSEVFETIFMNGIETRSGLSCNVHAESVARVLRSMLAYRLDYVGMNRKRAPKLLKDLHQQLRETRFKQAREQHLLCTGCNKEVVDNESLEAITRDDCLVGSFKCAGCARPYCFSSSCDFASSCVGCGETGCKECGNVMLCIGGCAQAFCGKCISSFVSLDCCKTCGAKGCKRCGIIRKCTNCEDKLCGNCVTACTKCDNARFCGKCECDSLVQDCKKCGMKTCVPCRTENDYPYKETDYCQDCQEGLERCGTCGVLGASVNATCSQCNSDYVSCNQCIEDGCCSECRARKRAKIHTTGSD